MEMYFEVQVDMISFHFTATYDTYASYYVFVYCAEFFLIFHEGVHLLPKYLKVKWIGS